MIELKENLLFKGYDFSQVSTKKERAESEDFYDGNTVHKNNIFEYYDNEKSILFIYYIKNSKIKLF